MTYMRAQLYSLETGIFTGTGISADKETIQANTPAGFGAYIISSNAPKPDILNKKVDISAIMPEDTDSDTWQPPIVDYIPPAPESTDLYTYTWNAELCIWEKEFTLAYYKRVKWLEIKSVRDSLEFGTFIWDSSEFDSTSDAQSRIQGAAQLATLSISAGQPFSIDWTLADNTVRTLSGEDMINVGLALGQHVSSIHAIARVLRASIDSATTKEEVEAVIWP